MGFTSMPTPAEDLMSDDMASTFLVRCSHDEAAYAVGGNCCLILSKGMDELEITGVIIFTGCLFGGVPS